MGMFAVFDVAASGITAQTVRMNTIASNLANANSAASTEQAAYRAKAVIFQTELQQAMENSAALGVKVAGISESSAPARMNYEPNHPQANQEGYVYYSNVNMVEEMANMIATSRSFQNNVNVIETTKKLMERTLAMGQ